MGPSIVFPGGEDLVDRWDGPFRPNEVRGFLAHMREGATVQLFRDGAAPDGGREAELLGWLQRDRSGRFVGLTGASNVLSGDALDLKEAVRAFAELAPEWVLHNVDWKPRTVVGAVEDVSPLMRDAVREIVADPDSGGSDWLKLRKIEHWKGHLLDWGLAGAALTALGYPDKPDHTSKALAPTVRDAFEEFKAKRPDLEPW